MGCDVHAIYQVKHDRHTGWFYEGSPPTTRDYPFFGILAGVRTDPTGGPIAYPRGFPPGHDDIDARSPLYFAEHTMSYLTLEDFENDVNTRVFGYDFTKRLYCTWLEQMRALARLYAVPTDDVRVVFGFDS